MVNSQEIIERSIYVAILNMAIKLGYTINPEDYLPTSAANAERFKEDLKKITDEKGFYVSIFGVGNNHSKGIKETPRIVVDSEGFYPGDIGLPRQIIEKEEGIGYTATEVPYETLSQYDEHKTVCSFCRTHETVASDYVLVSSSKRLPKTIRRTQISIHRKYIPPDS